MGPRRPSANVEAFTTSMACCDLDLYLQNLIRLSVEASRYPLQVSSRSLNLLMKYRGNKICLDEWTNVVDGQPKKIMTLPRGAKA